MAESRSERERAGRPGTGAARDEAGAPAGTSGHSTRPDVAMVQQPRRAEAEEKETKS